MATDVSGQHIGPIIKGQASKNIYPTVLGMRDPEETAVSKAHTAFIFKQSTLLGVLMLTSGALRSCETSPNIYQSTRRYIPSRYESSRRKPTSQSPLLQHRSSAKIARPASQNSTELLSLKLHNLKSFITHAIY